MATAAFVGTTQKCKACEKTVYLVDQLAADNKVHHKACFRCHHCKNTLKLSNYCSFEGVLYYKPHFDQLFKMTGSLDKSFEVLREPLVDPPIRFIPAARYRACLLEPRTSVLPARRQFIQPKRWLWRDIVS
ncbi:hypothetical protein MLD38_031972 [Melastoma candidum]|uniref:Uncharacterized protein n=1 Tax=Melastoma candidum TaxID=119954 RepID=A0ACB9MRW5_9MYRT|nr:hypothetical protein MLD38_031972 [Melastoma candidum]